MAEETKFAFEGLLTAVGPVIRRPTGHESQLLRIFTYDEQKTKGIIRAAERFNLQVNADIATPVYVTQVRSMEGRGKPIVDLLVHGAVPEVSLALRNALQNSIGMKSATLPQIKIGYKAELITIICRFLDQRIYNPSEKGIVLGLESNPQISPKFDYTSRICLDEIVGQIPYVRGILAKSKMET